MRTFLAAAAIAGIFAAAPASAVVITSTTAPGGNLAQPVELSSSQISVDFDFFTFSPITLGFGVQAGDAASYNFDSAIDVFTGVGPQAEGFAQLVLSLTNGATFQLGTVSPAFSVATTSLNAAGNMLTIRFSPSETTGLTLGSLDDIAGDFRINRNNVGAGGSFALSLAPGAVPEPAAWAMMIAGFGLVGGAMRYRTRGTGFAA